MKLSLSTNWCNMRFTCGEEIADKAMELGFDELELGFRTTQEQVAGFKARRDQMPIGSIHAYCPIPVSAPVGHPELYRLASLSSDERALARFHVVKNIEFAADMGADTVVLHAGRQGQSWLWRLFKRTKKLMSVFQQELEILLPTLEKYQITLAFENLPYSEAFPDEEQTKYLVEHFASPYIKGWFDTGHHRVRESRGWLKVVDFQDFAGMHLNDVVDVHDDHLPPGEGHVDFAALKPLAERVRHVVMEPNATVPEKNLKAGVAFIRSIFLV